MNTESNIAEQEHLTNDQEPLGPYSRENIVGRKKKKTSDDGTSELLTTLNKCIETRKNKEDILKQDEDRMFLMSLLSSFRAIPEHKKSAAKIQLISVIESFRSSTQNNILYPNTMWRNFNEYEYERRYFTPEAGRSTAPSQQSRPEAQHYYTLPTSTPSERERPESRFSTVTSNTSQDSDILDLF
ncbi:unnamed protein product [Parnassius apollo]|uniref:(apollo) hypothetical protein n=1 Tax=Parnassius apollo TaxID=110799 RepID=A0A8S3XWB6_PARAO|nr:unnamed protein product [Parnassius apollo]